MSSEPAMTRCHCPVLVGLLAGAGLALADPSDDPGPAWADPTAPWVIGARADVGRETLGKRVAGGLVGQVTGAVGLGRSQQSAGPQTRPDPTRRVKFAYSEAARSEIEVGARGQKDGHGLLISQRIKQAGERGTFHQTYLVDCRGEILLPARVELFSLWSEQGLSVSWSRTTRVDGQVVNQQTGGFSHSRRATLEGEVSDYPDDAAAPTLEELPGIWQAFGFERAYAGPRSVGAWFDVNPDQADEWLLVTHVTQPLQDPVMTQALSWRVDHAPHSEPLELLALPDRSGAGTNAWDAWQARCTERGLIPAPIITAPPPTEDPWRHIAPASADAKLAGDP